MHLGSSPSEDRPAIVQRDCRPEFHQHEYWYIIGWHLVGRNFSYSCVQLIVSVMWRCEGEKANAAGMSDKSGACGAVKKEVTEYVSGWSLGSRHQHCICGPASPWM